MTTDDDPTNVLYLPYAEGTKKLHELRRELDGALRAQRRAMRWLWCGIVAAVAVSVCLAFFVLGVMSR